MATTTKQLDLPPPDRSRSRMKRSRCRNPIRTSWLSCRLPSNEGAMNYRAGSSLLRLDRTCRVIGRDGSQMRRRACRRPILGARQQRLAGSRNHRSLLKGCWMSWNVRESLVRVGYRGSHFGWFTASGNTEPHIGPREFRTGLLGTNKNSQAPPRLGRQLQTAKGPIVQACGPSQDGTHLRTT